MSLSLIGQDLMVPLVTGGTAREINLDYAASAPCLPAVADAVTELLPWYASVHRGAGWKSRLCTRAYEAARDVVRVFAGARPDDCVIFTRHATEGINLLAASLPPGTRVVCWASEHHANLLPWRRHDLTVLPIPADPQDALADLERHLQRSPQVGVVAVTGASNVTGELWPVSEISELAHRYGARLLLDAAQLAPHCPLDMTMLGADWVVFSGHKLYAPFGAGCLIGCSDWLSNAEPWLRGGGTVLYVHPDEVAWAALPDRQEGGSPNVVGAVALGVACRELDAPQRAIAMAREMRLIELAEALLAEVPGVHVLRCWPENCPRIGVLTFVVDAVPYARLAAVLSAEYGIATRHGCFCAHPLMAHLLHVDDATARVFGASRRVQAGLPIPGAVRVSVGLGTTEADIVDMALAVGRIVRDGPAWDYQGTLDGTECWPVPDPREYPVLPFPIR
jgi:selenocysteine lyase/cysteine desulfurase